MRPSWATYRAGPLSHRRGIIRPGDGTIFASLHRACRDPVVRGDLDISVFARADEVIE